MTKKIFNTLTNLIQTPSLSGYEMHIQKQWSELFSNSNIKVSEDVHGNCYASLNNKTKSNLTISIDAHCDEIGLIVRYIDNSGFIYFSTIGGIDIDLFLGHRVIIYNNMGTFEGVICKKPIDYSFGEDIVAQKHSKTHEIYIDIGSLIKEETKNKINIGDPIVFKPNISEIGPNIIITKSADDKVGLVTITESIIELSENTLRNNIIAVSTVQEEIGMRGAKTSAPVLNPDISISIDVMECTDYPNSNPKKTGEIFLNKGPIIYRGPNINHKLSDFILNVASKYKIPYQLCGLSSTNDTNAGAFQISKAGSVASTLIDIPLRYMHTPSEIISLLDIKNTISLVVAVIKELEDGIDLTFTKL